ncbi:MAG: hypothetical protein FJZ96_04520 [Chloroflexi bacterium]|nr:hypothetical protein [Chloroflexota bacterium]
MKKFHLLLAVLLVASMTLAACQPAEEPIVEPTEEIQPTEEPVATEPPAPALGTAEHPIKMLWVPSGEAEAILTGGEALAAKLLEVTGYHFVVSVPTSYAATIEELCASPDDSMAFIPGLGYVLANQLCGVQVQAKAIRFGLDWYAAEFVVLRDSAFQTVADLNGAKWATASLASTSGYLYPLLMLTTEGATPSEIVESGSHDAAMLAVYNGEADFATAYYTPPLVDGVSLGIGSLDAPDVPADLIDSCANTAEDKDIACGNWIVKDARRTLRKVVPDTIQRLRILAVTVPLPNDTLSFGANFPAEVSDNILQALYDWAASDAEGFATVFTAYSWTSIVPAEDSEYDPIRLAVQNAGYVLEDLK